jgi:MvdD family ATP-grasp ribosomal peptide maturase
MTVLIITKSDDNECVPNVIRAVEERGERAVRFDTDRFPTEVEVSLAYERGWTSYQVRSGDEQVDLGDVTGIWYRRTRFGGGIPETMDRQLRSASVKESGAVVLGMIASLDAFHLDPVLTIRRASHKPLQLKVARAAGLETPETLISNSPEAVRRFVGGRSGGVVTKMMTSFAVFDEQGAEQVVFTTPISDADLVDLDGLHYCPMMFQERIPKKLELRTTIVGDRVFTASIDPRLEERAGEDWRRAGTELVEQWQQYTLPSDVEAKLLKLMDALNLNYGAIDIIVTPDERHVFLEINPAGEFFWLELAPGFPISGALADVLLNRSARREHPGATV